MSVLAQATARGDVLLRRSTTNEWAIRWERSEDGGATYVPVSWAGVTGELQLCSPLGEQWLSHPVSLERSGLARMLLPAGLLSAQAWLERGHGQWRVNITYADGGVERLGDGYFYMEE